MEGMTQHITRDDIIDFIYQEARMLDEGRYDEWLSLWLEIGIYWMPLDYKQTDPISATSLLYEDHFMLRLRVERLNGARTFSQKPKSRCHHVLQRLSWIFSNRTRGVFRPIHRCITSKPVWMSRFY